LSCLRRLNLDPRIDGLNDICREPGIDLRSKGCIMVSMDRFRWLPTYYPYFTGYIPAGEGLVPEVS
jgi:hypothetical protein